MQDVGMLIVSVAAVVDFCRTGRVKLYEPLIVVPEDTALLTVPAAIEMGA